MIFEKFEITLISLGQSQNFSKMYFGNLSQIALPDMWLLVLILHCYFAITAENFKRNNIAHVAV